MSKASGEVYGLISELLSLLGRYDRPTLHKALKHVEQSFNGPDRLVLSSILEGLLRHEHIQPGLNERPHQPRRDDPFSPEVGAILREFAESTSVSVFASMVGELLGRTFETRGKESRDRVVDRALKAFSELPSAAQDRIYRSLRRVYIKNRGSTLSDWADIISNRVDR